MSQEKFSTDGHTRVILFALNMQLQEGENSSAVTAEVEDSEHRIYPLAVESVGAVPQFDWLTQMVVKLPDEIANGGDVLISIKLHGETSNKVMVRIKP